MSMQISLNKNYAMAHFGLAANLVWAGRGEEALAALDTAIRISPKDQMLWGFSLMKGIAHAGLLEFEDAEFWFRKSIDQRSQGFWAQLNLMHAFHRQGKTDEAQIALKDVLEIRPDISQGLARSFIPSFHSPYFDLIEISMGELGIPE